MNLIVMRCRWKDACLCVSPTALPVIAQVTAE